MINWLKNFFKTTPGEGVVPITQKDYIYMGDGTMEEVRHQDQEVLTSEEEVRIRLKKLNEEFKQRQSIELDTTPIAVAVAVSSWTGDSSYSSYDSGSCDSSSSSCD